MAGLGRIEIRFLAIGTTVFAGLAGLMALVRMKLALWYLAHCGRSSACTAANLATDYWWIVLLGLVLAAAWRINLHYQASIAAPETRAD